MSTDKPIVILGGGGHATVLIEVLRLCQKKICGFIAPSAQSLKNNEDIPYLGDDQALLLDYPPAAVKCVNGVGAVSVIQNTKRRKLFEYFKNLGYEFETLIHPSAIVASNVVLKEGAQVMARSVIQPNTVISENVIINTSASIDHDCLIGHSVHIAPGAILSGQVILGENTHVGVGTNIIQGIKVKENTMIVSGKTVVSDII